MKSLLHSKYCLNAKTQKKIFIFFLCQSDVCKNQKPSLNHFGFLNVPLTHTIDPNNPKLFFQIALFTSFPMIPISYFCKINWIFDRTFSESMSNFFRCSVLQSSLTQSQSH